MVRLRFETDIHASAERIFSLLVDLRDYDRWLPRSTAFYGTTEISDGAIRVGTTYVERSPFGVRRGIVTHMDEPTRLDFEQPMTHAIRALGVIGIKLFHTLTPGNGWVHVLRELELTPSGPVKLAMPLIVRAFRTENERMIRMLKAFAERTS